MGTHLILVVSNVRPSNTWRIAKRITREVPGAEICGIIQRPLQKLSLVQRLIAADHTEHSTFLAPFVSKASLRFQPMLKRLVHSALWCIHGSPNKTSFTQFTTERLAKECGDTGWPFLLAEDLKDSSVLKFVEERKPELALLLGEATLSPELLGVPPRGWIRAGQSTPQDDASKAPADVAIRIESFTRSSDNPFTIACLTLPLQPYDGLAGQTLKADLISEDLAVQSVIHLLAGSMVEAANEVREWMQQMFSPYLKQLAAARVTTVEKPTGPTRHRPTWKLWLDTLLLCSPLIVARNWYRRLRRRYPITILTHHVVSDRRHRMGISTELFWQQVRFLQRHYRIVSLTEAVELLESGSVEVPTAVLTFDDGYADNFVSLRAVAAETGIPVTLFIATQPVELQQEFEHDLVNGVRGAFPLTWQQIRYWGLQGVEFGSHTRTHFDCGCNDRTKLEWEIVGSRNDLERYLRRAIEIFAFPFGRHENISAEALELAAASYRHFVSGFGGENQCREQTGNQHLLRKGFYANAWELELDLQSIFDLVDNVKRKLHLRRSESRSRLAFHGFPVAITRRSRLETHLNP